MLKLVYMRSFEFELYLCVLTFLLVLLIGFLTAVTLKQRLRAPRRLDKHTDACTDRRTDGFLTSWMWDLKTLKALPRPPWPSFDAWGR